MHCDRSQPVRRRRPLPPPTSLGFPRRVGCFAWVTATRRARTRPSGPFAHTTHPLVNRSSTDPPESFPRKGV